jgi:hypothetical protein
MINRNDTTPDYGVSKKVAFFFFSSLQKDTNTISLKSLRLLKSLTHKLILNMIDLSNMLTFFYKIKMNIIVFSNKICTFVFETKPNLLVFVLNLLCQRVQY